VTQFYLHIKRSNGILEDPEGSDVPDIGAARSEALKAARDLVVMAIQEQRDLDIESICISTADGEMLDEVPLTEALPKILVQRLRHRDMP
jgi:hypothetical protein